MSLHLPRMLHCFFAQSPYLINVHEVKWNETLSRGKGLSGGRMDTYICMVKSLLFT